ncbi:hypothetical protein RRF57_007691 [Xylaria bambusicola]|uniref:Uncharacterized protein n=1 Tax=Xylaria bambusicola TaxID=326684 RepID=A0AAN7UN60_9PEZI
MFVEVIGFQLPGESASCLRLGELPDSVSLKRTLGRAFLLRNRKTSPLDGCMETNCAATRWRIQSATSMAKRMPRFLNQSIS